MKVKAITTRTVLPFQLSGILAYDVLVVAQIQAVTSVLAITKLLFLIAPDCAA